MSPFWSVLTLSMSAILGYLISLTSLHYYLPQLIALATILYLIINHFHLPTQPLIAFVVNLVVFVSGGLASPFYFLIYFLLFSTAFSLHPAYSLVFTLLSILLLGQSLDSPTSIIPLLSLLFITPLVWLVSRQNQAFSATTKTLAQDETDVLLWLNLKFKTGITTIIDLCSQVQSTPLSYIQKSQLKKIRDSAHSLLNSSQKLTSEISDTTDEI